MTSAEPREYRGKIYYNTRNYAPKQYTYRNMAAHGSAQMLWSDFLKNAVFAKAMCLSQAGRDPETTMFAVEKDEDYLPEFRECVKSNMTSFLEQRAADPQGRLSYTLRDDVADTAVDKVLDQINLQELEDLDRDIYFAKKQEYRAKWNDIHKELSGE